MTEQNKVTDDRLITKEDLEGLKFELINSGADREYRRNKTLQQEYSISVTLFAGGGNKLFVYDAEELIYMEWDRNLKQLNGSIAFLEE